MVTDVPSEAPGPRTAPLDAARRRRVARVLGGVLVVYALLVAPHEGEFWPLSIYPMFSRAKRTIDTPLARDVTGIDPGTLWALAPLDALPGRPIGLSEHGVEAVDFASYVRGTETWDAARRKGLEDLLAPLVAGGRALLVMEVEGEITSTRSGAADLRARPVVLVTAEGTATEADAHAYAERAR